MSKHTPGPWTVQEGEMSCFHRGNRYAITHEVRDGDEVMCPTIAEVWPATDGSDAADARLIAAAPTMVDLLDEYLDIAEGLLSRNEIKDDNARIRMINLMDNIQQLQEALEVTTKSNQS